MVCVMCVVMVCGVMGGVGWRDHDRWDHGSMCVEGGCQSLNVFICGTKLFFHCWTIGLHQPPGEGMAPCLLVVVRLQI